MNIFERMTFGLESLKSKRSYLVLALGAIVGFSAGRLLPCSSSEGAHAEATKSSEAINLPVHKAERKTKENAETSTRYVDDWDFPSAFFRSAWRPWFYDSYIDSMLDFDRIARPAAFSDRDMLSHFSGSRISETDNEIQVRAEVPGVDAKDLDLTVNDDSITIKGKKESESENKQNKDESMIRSASSFEQSFQLPCKVESDKAVATLKNGILRISIPKCKIADNGSKKLKIEEL
ncbi:MAG: Hsp20/alpha crystallin family protein [Candidatus Obscuribacterales bacterium]|nr:Hsp20/alpha crystallin family protein [Candidatus Obscuribacterales bacterium]